MRPTWRASRSRTSAAAGSKALRDARAFDGWALRRGQRARAVRLRHCCARSPDTRDVRQTDPVPNRPLVRAATECGQSLGAPLTTREIWGSTPRGPGHGLAVVGSHTDLTNAQVGRLRADSSIAEVVLDVPLVADVNARAVHLRRVSADTVEALAGADVLLVTSRARQQAGNGEANVQLARTVSAAITQRDADRSCGRPRLGRHEGRHHLPRCSGHRSRNSARDRARPGSSRDDLGAQPRRRAVGRAGQARRRVRRQCRRRNETR